MKTLTRIDIFQLHSTVNKKLIDGAIKKWQINTIIYAVTQIKSREHSGTTFRSSENSYAWIILEGDQKYKFWSDSSKDFTFAKIYN